MGRMKEEFIRRLESREPDMDQYTSDEPSFHYGDKVRVTRGFYRGTTGVVYQYLQGGGIAESGYLLAVPDILEDGTSKKAVIVGIHELEVFQ